LAQIAHEIHGTPAPVIPRGNAFAEMVLTHYDAIVRFYGTKLGLRMARKHLGWYMDHAGTPPAARRAVLTAASVEQTMILLPDALSEPEGRVAA